jgi:Rieske Fe-S protein
MPIRRALVPSLAVATLAFALFAAVAAAQAQRGGGAAPPARGTAAPPARGGAAPASAPQAHANLNQVMRGILFPNSNVVFAVQSDDPTKQKGPREPSAATDPLTGLYGGWEAVENSSLAIAEAANLLVIPRRCSNGRMAPVQNADWQKFVQGLRDVGMEGFKVAQKKDQDAIVEFTDKMSVTCANCHDVYRDKTPQQGGVKNRCVAN